MNRSKKLSERIDDLLESSVPMLSDSLNEKARFSLRAYDPETSKSLFKGNADSATHVKSLLNSAASHMKDGGMNKIRVTVQDHKHGVLSDHKLTKKPDGSIHTSGPDPVSHFDD